ncbi:WD40-repeat-containing domain protein [Emericellopsis atlantica]|uniref:WD40-repeat-containing domain protein n=1 Tax=Emericellopsis atlantica TaxID=2614577 RepID=A0A9P8CS77_9HYPO|nr:WD40-repeat-containing domain protein [Emericellopsis atlantica]KAG9257518.1 WD40-repeat-containing domain protein [Emericellopsis atlantica]
MASTPSNRLRLTPSNSPFLPRPSRSPMRGRSAPDSRLSLKRVVGTTCSCPGGFDTVQSSFAYCAGAAVVVVDIDGDQYTQRFFRARPSAIPTYPATTFHNAPSTPNGTPKANDSRGRAAPRDSIYGGADWSDSSGSKTWTSRERIKAATCLALSRDGRYLAVGETGYAPRVLIFNLQDSSSDTPLVSISEHAFGVRAVAWSADSRWLASLGEANDGFLYVWKIDPRNGSARLFQQNRCTSYVKSMLWLGNSLITMGVRHVKVWKVEEFKVTSPTKQRFLAESGSSTPSSRRALPGRNVLLGSMLEATFTCASVDGKKLVVCTEAGDVCIFDDEVKQVKLVRVLNVGFAITSIIIRGDVAYVGGEDGQFATLDVQGVMEGVESSILSSSRSSRGVVAMGFLTHKLVTIDANHSIDIWNPDDTPGRNANEFPHITLPGHGEAIVGCQTLPTPNRMDAAFYTWSASGIVAFWDLEGRVRSLVRVAVDTPEQDAELGIINQLTCARVSKYGKLLVTADRQGILKVTDIATDECILDTKAHTSDCVCISLYEDDTKFMMATCGRDRTTQLFHRNSKGQIEHFQTLDFNSKVVAVAIPSPHMVFTCSMERTMQVHEILSREDEPDVMAAVPHKVISLKASPTSMEMSRDGSTAFVSFLDRSVSQFDLNNGRQVHNFKCVDEGGAESAVLDCLNFGQWPPKELDFLLGVSNTDKSIRLYDANSGAFIDREWGHTEAINGLCLIEGDDGTKKVVSVGSDATIMIWALDLNDSSPRSSISRDPSPVKEATSARPTLRRVLSKAELAEFQKPSPGNRPSSPPRTLRRRRSRMNLAVNSSAKTPTGPLQASPSSSTIAEDTPSKRPTGDSRQYSPPTSPRGKTVTRRPSLPALGPAARKTSGGNLRSAFGTLNMATEQTCRTLRVYRKKLESAEPLSPEVLAELDRELRLTAAALGDRAIRSKAMNETVLSGLLDQYSERLVTLLDEKMRLTYQPRAQEKGSESPDECRAEGTPEDSGSSSP